MVDVQRPARNALCGRKFIDQRKWRSAPIDHGEGWHPGGKDTTDDTKHAGIGGASEHDAHIVAQEWRHQLGEDRRLAFHRTVDSREPERAPYHVVVPVTGAQRASQLLAAIRLRCQVFTPWILHSQALLVGHAKGRCAQQTHLPAMMIEQESTRAAPPTIRCCRGALFSLRIDREALRMEWTNCSLEGKVVLRWPQRTE